MSGEKVQKSEVQHRLLKDMGIDAWYLREAVPDRVEAAPTTGTDTAMPKQAPADTTPSQRHADPQPVTQTATVSAPTASGDLPAAGDQAVEPFAVQALGVPGALLIAGTFARAGDAVLARDIVRTARRAWSASVRQAGFSWPQAGASGEPAPALGAFIEKQAEDCAAETLLVTESAAARLGDCALTFVSIPDLDTLADPQNKVALWRRLQALAR